MTNFVHPKKQVSIVLTLLLTVRSTVVRFALCPLKVDKQDSANGAENTIEAGRLAAPVKNKNAAEPA